MAGESLGRRRIEGVAARGLIALALVALSAAAAAAPASAAPKPPPNPVVQGPVLGGIHGYPWNHSLYDLRGKGFDYTEREYLYSGTATSSAKGGAGAPYTSRMLVRLPRDRKKFNGSVVVEWLNVTGQADLETAWPVEAQYLMRHGFGYVGVSAQLAGVCCGPTTLKGWDPKRYAALAHPGDPFSYDIFSQAIRALRDPSLNKVTAFAPKRINPVRGMRVRRLVVTGASQSAFFLTTFVNGGYNRGQIDAYVITRGGGPFNDFSTPIFQLNEENNPAPQRNNAHYVAWEEAGTAHAPQPWWNYIWAEDQRDVVTPGAPDPISAACSVNRGSVDYSSRALSHWVSRYLRTGKLPPAAPRVRRNASGNIVRDANGLAEGGLRHVFVQVPISHNTSDGCTLYGNYTQWGAAKIKSLYPTHADYVAKVSAWSKHEVKRGWLLPADRRDVLGKAKRWAAPWTGGDAPPPQGL